MKRSIREKCQTRREVLCRQQDWEEAVQGQHTFERNTEFLEECAAALAEELKKHVNHHSCPICFGPERATLIANEILEGRVEILEECCEGCCARIHHAIAQEISYIQMTGRTYCEGSSTGD